MNTDTLSKIDPSLLSPQAQVQRWDAEHGAHILIDGQFFLYEDGARRDFDPRGIWRKPPSDERERMRLVIYYHDTLLKRARSKFEEMQKQLRLFASLAIKTARDRVPTPPPSKQQIEELEAMAKLVRQRQSTVQALREKLEITTRDPERDARAAKITEAASDAISAIDSIKI